MWGFWGWFKLYCMCNECFLFYIYIYMLLFELNKNSVYLINNLNVVLFNDIFRFFLFGFY